ncbi:hypothetical protein Hosp_032 [Mycobacterium phage Hosp]|nr:hypothetical protein FH38_gp32 [Mycobacterium phage Hosp]AHK11986.1 hypothetical protein Hosp_032 [Mycobacterium phage Hosp]
MTAHNWRAVRARYADKGIADPMGQVTTMHAVLDVMEQIGAESSTNGAKTAAEAKSEITRYFDKLYKPDVTARVIDGDGYMPPPPGFSEEEMEASFDAFLGQGLT